MSVSKPQAVGLIAQLTNALWKNVPFVYVPVSKPQAVGLIAQPAQSAETVIKALEESFKTASGMTYCATAHVDIHIHQFDTFEVSKPQAVGLIAQQRQLSWTIAAKTSKSFKTASGMTYCATFVGYGRKSQYNF